MGYYFTNKYGHVVYVDKDENPFDATIKEEYKRQKQQNKVEKDINELNEKTLKIMDKLTDEEKKAISGYSGMSYYGVTEHLLGKEVDFDIAYVYNNIDEIKHDINLIESGINKSIINKPLTTFRGTDHDFANAQIGDVIPVNYFPSTTLKYSTAIKHANKRGKSPIVWEIHTPRGVKALYLGDNFNSANENELLIQRGYNYKILDISTKNDKNYGQYKKYVLELIK